MKVENWILSSKALLRAENSVERRFLRQAAAMRDRATATKLCAEDSAKSKPGAVAAHNRAHKSAKWQSLAFKHVAARWNCYKFSQKLTIHRSLSAWIQNESPYQPTHECQRFPDLVVLSLDLVSPTLDCKVNARNFKSQFLKKAQHIKKRRKRKTFINRQKFYNFFFWYHFERIKVCF